MYKWYSTRKRCPVVFLVSRSVQIASAYTRLLPIPTTLDVLISLDLRCCTSELNVSCAFNFTSNIIQNTTFLHYIWLLTYKVIRYSQNYRDVTTWPQRLTFDHFTVVAFTDRAFVTFVQCHWSDFSSIQHLHSKTDSFTLHYIYTTYMAGTAA